MKYRPCLPDGMSVAALHCMFAYSDEGTIYEDDNNAAVIIACVTAGSVLLVLIVVIVLLVIKCRRRYEYYSL